MWAKSLFACLRAELLSYERFVSFVFLSSFRCMTKTTLLRPLLGWLLPLFYLSIIAASSLKLPLTEQVHGTCSPEALTEEVFAAFCALKTPPLFYLM